MLFTNLQDTDKYRSISSWKFKECVLRKKVRLTAIRRFTPSCTHMCLCPHSAFCLSADRCTVYRSQISQGQGKWKWSNRLRREANLRPTLKCFVTFLARKETEQYNTQPSQEMISTVLGRQNMVIYFRSFHLSNLGPVAKSLQETKVSYHA